MKEKNSVKRLAWQRWLGLSLLMLLIPLIWLGAQSPQRAEVLSHLVREGLTRWHYAGKKLDIETSRMVIEEYVRYLDLGKRFLYASDVDQIQKLGQTIPSALQSGNLVLVDQSVKLVLVRMEETWRFIEPLFDQVQPERFDKVMELDPDKRGYFQNAAEMESHWRQYVRQRILSRLFDLWAEEKEKKDQKKGSKPVFDFTALEAKARADVRKIFATYFKRIREIQDEDRLGRFLNALLSVYDPHTSYFAPRDQEDFNIEMSGSFEGIGALLGERDDYIQVMQIIVGGPSWRDQRLEVGDKIVKVGQEQEEPVDVTGIRVTDAVKLIRGKKGSRVTLIVKKPDGRVEKVVIQRDIVVVEETFAKSALFTDPDKKSRFGYVYLPSFYNDFSGKTKRNATDDVKKAVLELKQSGISGLVLDLRGNGGGSLDDAIRISGLFIDEGPIMQVKNREQGLKVYTDPEPGSIYDGPMVVLIDAVSASASEIVAAALQDYRRALIVGGQQSFGKATVQVMLDLDEFLRGNDSQIKPLGALKMTVQAFYRVNGDTSQFKGVIPDIVLPASNDYLEVGERFYDHPLRPQSIAPATFSPVKSPYNLDRLKKLSETRIAQSTYFKQIRQYIEILKDRQRNSSVPLDWPAYKSFQEKERSVLDSFSQSERPPHFAVQAIQEAGVDGDRLAEERRQTMESWIKELKKDAYIEEALWIMGDVLGTSVH